jgi:hypothetical protein
MDTLVTLNFVGYAAVFAGGMVLGTLFGRNLANELSGLVHALESRVMALETAVHSTSATAKTTPDPTTAAINSHAEATEKLAAASQTHAAVQAAGTEKGAGAAKPASN